MAIMIMVVPGLSLPDMSVTQPAVSPSIRFTLTTKPASQHGPRIGNILLRRSEHLEKSYSIPTPNFLTSTSRGVVPHLSRDHHNQTEAIRWVNVPFETFLDQNPPVPTLQTGRHPLHTFLGFNPSQHVLSMTIRDPSDGRDMPPNGNSHVSVYCLRGVQRISPSDWRSYSLSCQPDVVVALSDIPFTDPPYSQKRLTKSIDRSGKWLADIIRTSEDASTRHPNRPSILVHMTGGASIAARRAFANSLLETDAEHVAPLRCLDEGVIGYTFDLVPLRLSLHAAMKKARDGHLSNALKNDNLISSLSETQVSADHLISLLNASLESLPVSKLRVANTTTSPHEMLQLIQRTGIDLFDAYWAQSAANIGVALDFVFPAPTQGALSDKDSKLRTRANGKRDLGHNLYDSVYASDFSSLAECFSPASATSTTDSTGQGKQMCLCLACSPLSPKARICHGPPELEDDQPASENVVYRPPFTRAYLHHLLQTHEMSAHSFLVMHNLTVLDAFFAGVRNAIQREGDFFEREVERFIQVYDEDMVIFEEAAMNWRDVDLARGKGRLAREKDAIVV